jgi:hypothetical protein
MMIRSAPAASAHLAEIPVPAPAPRMGVPRALFALHRSRHAERSVHHAFSMCRLGSRRARPEIYSTSPVPELLDLLQRLWGERRLAFKCMEHNPFEQITQAHVLQFGDGLQHLEQPLFHPDAGLNPFHLYRCPFACHLYQCTMVRKMGMNKSGGLPPRSRIRCDILCQVRREINRSPVGARRR